MTTKFDKAKKKMKKNKKWYIINTKNYSYYIWVLPIIPFVELKDFIVDRVYENYIWDEKKASKVLDIILPKILNWDEDDKAYYYNTDWTFSFSNYVPFYYRTWTKKFTRDLKWYLIDKYENSNYTKTIEEDNFDCWIVFKEKSLDK